ncbi:MAG: guanylate kinase [Pseudomonadota bacterium]|nr:guanylate kinase [Pseudomonadota bacterium]
MGKLFVIAAPSGAGKTTLVRRVMEINPSLEFSISYTTRKQRHTEKHGEDYFFINKKDFKRMIVDQDFIEHAIVFENLYGTSKKQIKNILSQGKNAILEIDWQGARQVKENMPECQSIFILPPSLEELKNRLYKRGTESEKNILRRLRDSISDLSHWNEFDYVVINKDLDKAVKNMASIINGNGSQYDANSPHIMREATSIADKALK